jgi:sec-independent protein translocase protein TatC
MRKGRKSPDEMTFLEHLEDLRKRLLGSIIALLVAVIPSWMFSQDIYRILSRPVTQYLPEGTKLAFTSLTAPFTLYMKVAFLSAAFFTSPFIFYQLWKFIAPGLYQKEKKYVIPFVVFTSAFFLGGALFGYYVAFPFACRFFLNLGSEFQPVITVDTFFSLTIKLLLGIGLVFEMPTLIFFLSRMGIVTAGWMLKKFKYAILVIFIIAALITPTPDIVNQAILAVPMIVLYSLSILIALIFGKKKKPRDEDDSKQAG